MYSGIMLHLERCLSGNVQALRSKIRARTPGQSAFHPDITRLSRGCHFSSSPSTVLRRLDHEYSVAPTVSVSILSSFSSFPSIYSSYFTSSPPVHISHTLPLISLLYIAHIAESPIIHLPIPPTSSNNGVQNPDPPRHHPLRSRQDRPRRRAHAPHVRLHRGQRARHAPV